MTHGFFSASRHFVLSLALAVLLLTPLAASAEDGATGAVSHTEASKASDAAQKKPAEAAKDEDAPALSPAEKTSAINAADEIATFDEEKVVGNAKPWQVYYQESVSPMMKTIEKLHDMVFVIILAIVILVMVLMLYIILRFNRRANPVAQTFTHNTTIEIIWTVIPILILVAIGIPSIRAHYQVYFNETALTNPDLTIKIVGHQWYWSYEYPDEQIAFDSNIKAEKELVNGEPRLLAVDNPIVVPVNKVVRLQMTGADVIHAWAVPAFGVKKDVMPGRLNETWFKAEREGIYFGQCSELCGKGHGFMPIMVYVVSDEDYATWVKGAKLKFAANDAMQFAALN